MATSWALKARAAEAWPSNFKTIDCTGFENAICQPPRDVVAGLLPRGHGTLLGGHGGAGKSMLAEIIAAHAAAGRRWAGLDVAQVSVVYVSLEDSADLLLDRLKRIVLTYGLDASAVEAGLTILDGSDGQAALATERNVEGSREVVVTAAMEEMTELVAGAGLIVIDNASDAFDGSENDRRQVRTFMRMLVKLARDNDAAVLLLAHIDKNAARHGSAGNSYSGSTAWHNSARSRLALVQTEAGIELRQEKLNLGRKSSPIQLAWTDNGVLVPSRLRQGDSLEEDRKAEAHDEELVLEAIDAAIAAGSNVPIGRTGSASTIALLQTFPELGTSFRGKSGKERFWGAITRVARAGKIVRDPYRDAHRNARERWVRADAAPATNVSTLVSCVA